MLHCVVTYLKNTPSAYNDGQVAAALERQAQYMETVKDRGAWARFWANMGGVEYDVAPLIYDSAKVGATGVEAHYRWCGEWYGKPVNVERAFSLLETDTHSQMEPRTMLADGWLVNCAVLLIETGESVVASQNGVISALSLSQVLLQASSRPRLLLLTHGSQVPIVPAGAAGICGTSNSGMWGLVRSVRMEYSSLSTHCKDAASGSCVRAPTVLALATEGEPEIVWRSSEASCALRLRPRGATSVIAQPGTTFAWLLTGGLGGLALRGASHARHR